MRGLRGKRCLITGAASGIGRATAIAAAEKGAVLFLTDIQAEALDAVAEKILAGIERNRFMVFTSADIHALHLVQRYVPPLYRLVIRVLDHELNRAVGHR